MLRGLGAWAGGREGEAVDGRGRREAGVWVPAVSERRQRL